MYYQGRDGRIGRRTLSASFYPAKDPASSEINIDKLIHKILGHHDAHSDTLNLTSL